MNPFTRHPADVDETYGQHAAFAARMGLTLMAAGAAAMIHGLLPFAFETTASRLISRLHARMTRRWQPAQPAEGLGSPG
jgi:hypothetical protein